MRSTRCIASRRNGARILAFGVHPYISGAAHRIKYFDADARLHEQKREGVVFWQGEQIYDWYAALVPPPQ